MPAVTSIEGIDPRHFYQTLRCDICDVEENEEVVSDTWECRQRKGHHFLEYLCPDCAQEDDDLNDEFARISRFAASGSLAAGFYGRRIAFLTGLGVSPDWKDG